MIDLEASKGSEIGESEPILREVGTRSASEVDQKLKEFVGSHHRLVEAIRLHQRGDGGDRGDEPNEDN